MTHVVTFRFDLTRAVQNPCFIIFSCNTGCLHPPSYMAGVVLHPGFEPGSCCLGFAAWRVGRQRRLCARERRRLLLLRVKLSRRNILPLVPHAIAWQHIRWLEALNACMYNIQTLAPCHKAQIYIYSHRPISQQRYLNFSRLSSTQSDTRC